MPEEQERELPSDERGTGISQQLEVELRAERLIAALAESFPDQGITINDWQAMAAKAMAASYRDRFLRIKPEAAVENVNTVVQHFAREGLTTRQYLQNILTAPLLLPLKPQTLIANIEAVASHFSSNGLTTNDYLKAAIKYPSLFAAKPSTIVGNIDAVARGFASADLTVRDYLRAALKQPSLFYRDPAAITANIECVVRHFANVGLTTKGYIRAGLHGQFYSPKNPRRLSTISRRSSVIFQAMV